MQCLAEEPRSKNSRNSTYTRYRSSFVGLGVNTAKCESRIPCHWNLPVQTRHFHGFQFNPSRVPLHRLRKRSTLEVGENHENLFYMSKLRVRLNEFF